MCIVLASELVGNSLIVEYGSGIRVDIILKQIERHINTFG